MDASSTDNHLIEAIEPNECTKDLQVENYLILIVHKKWKIIIYKRLIMLKIALFLWFSAAMSCRAFLSVFLKHRGLTVQDLSLMYMVIAVLQVLVTSFLSIVADKFERSKSILIYSLLFTAVTAIILVMIPPVRDGDLQRTSTLLQCYTQKNATKGKVQIECSLNETGIRIDSCEVFSDEDSEGKCNPQSLSCRSGTERKDETFSVSLNNSDPFANQCYYDVISACPQNESFSVCNDSWTSSCQISCAAKIPYNFYNKIFSKDQLTIIYVFICFFLMMSYINIFRFFDITVMAMVKEHNADYGIHRVFSSLGALIGPVFSGYMVHVLSQGEDTKYYDVVFYIYSAICMLTAFVVLKVDVRGTGPGRKMWKKSLALMKNTDVLVFLFALLVVGSTWGFVIVFKYWFLEDLSTKAYMIGLIEMSDSIYGFPILLASNWLIKNIGVNNIFGLALVGRAVHCLGYSFLQTAWPAFILELTSTVTYHLFWVAVMYYCSEISPPGLRATVNAFSGSVHFSFGRVIGSGIGGIIMSELGARTAFRVFGVLNIITAVICMCYWYLRQKNDTKKGMKNSREY